MTHDELVTRATAWLKKRKRCGVVLAEYHCWTAEIPDAIGFRNDYSILVECKAHKSDFQRDRRKPCRNRGENHFGNYRFFLVPEGLVQAEDIPEGWGLLYARPRGIAVIVTAPRHTSPAIKAEEYGILYSLGRRAELRGLIPTLTKPLDNGSVYYEGGK